MQTGRLFFFPLISIETIILISLIAWLALIILVGTYEGFQDKT